MGNLICCHSLTVVFSCVHNDYYDEVTQHDHEGVQLGRSAESYKRIALLGRQATGYVAGQISRASLASPLPQQLSAAGSNQTHR